jgi:hypothetical protein
MPDGVIVARNAVSFMRPNLAIVLDERGRATLDGWLCACDSPTVPDGSYILVAELTELR